MASPQMQLQLPHCAQLLEKAARYRNKKLVYTLLQHRNYHTLYLAAN